MVRLERARGQRDDVTPGSVEDEDARRDAARLRRELGGMTIVRPWERQRRWA